MERPDSGAGTRPERHAVFKFPFWAIILVPSQQRLTVFCVLRPHPVQQVLRQVQVWQQRGAPVVFSPGIGAGSFLSEPRDVEFDGGATFLEPVPCALSADVDGEFKSELQGARERGVPGEQRGRVRLL